MPSAVVITGACRNSASVCRAALALEAMTPPQRALLDAYAHQDLPFEQIAQLKPDGVFLSNGPGDPATADHIVGVTREVLGAGIPLFGICFGNQILGRALGFGTYKLGYGHRGINQPVLDRTTGKVEVTAHNHGFAVDAPLEGSTTTPRTSSTGRIGRCVARSSWAAGS